MAAPTTATPPAPVSEEFLGSDRNWHLTFGLMLAVAFGAFT